MTACRVVLEVWRWRGIAPGKQYDVVTSWGRARNAYRISNDGVSVRISPAPGKKTSAVRAK